MNFQFTMDDLHAPIFTDPPDDIGREDEWSGPYGFLLGGMGDPTNPEIAQQYLDSANQLVCDILEQRVEDYKVAMPILFLYRHAIEMMLKAAMQSGWGHELDKLADAFERFIADKHGQQVPQWIIARLHEISDIDPKSMSFRYAVKLKSRRGLPVPLGGEHYIDITRLQRGMNALYFSLASVIRNDRRSE